MTIPDEDLEDIGVCGECGDACLELVNGFCPSCIDELNEVATGQAGDWDDADPRQFVSDDPRYQ